MRPQTGLAVVGGQWGDEGKGKIVDLLSGAADVVARYQGGPNAGHTVHAGGRKFQLHHVPSGILHPETTCIVGNGMVLLPGSFLEEMRTLREAGIRLEDRLFISTRAHVILPIHVERDITEEEAGGGIGTTRRGVGPAYEAKYSRHGLRVEDLLDADRLRARLERAVPAGQVASTLEALGPFIDAIRPHVDDTVVRLNDHLDGGDRVLFEGAQGTLLDVDHGTYPYVTSSSSCAAGISAGLGVGPTRVGAVLGVMKAYCTRVGAGPMPTELRDEVGDRLRERGREYGTTTGRPRRCGWFDGVVARHAARINHLDAIALTLFDVLDGFDSLKVCTGYRHAGRELPGMPGEMWRLEEVEPVYVEVPGWRSDTTAIRGFDDLPEAARDYLRLVEELCGCPVALLSVGPDREQSVIRAGTPIAAWVPGHPSTAGG
jgi:adenylosuccinate synthase